MTLTFSSEDVRNHLESLGYKNISDRQLKDFVKDLKRLIRYEEKQKRLEKLKTIEEHPKSSLVNQFLFTFNHQIKIQFLFSFFSNFELTNYISISVFKFSFRESCEGSTLLVLLNCLGLSEFLKKIGDRLIIFYFISIKNFFS